MYKKGFIIILVVGLFLSLSAFHKNDTAPNPIDEFVVVLDAGHGGHDPGNLGNGYLEKDIALAIVIEAGKLLGKQKNIKVVYTRKDDTFIGLEKRGAIANESNADLFVSVHCNSHSSDASGAETFVLGLHANKQNFDVAKKENSVIYLEDNYEVKYGEYDINAPESVIGLTIMQEEFLEQSVQVAKLIQDNFTNKLNRKNRKVKQAGFIVLHQTFMPSVLVEVGFLTNRNEGAYLNSQQGKQEMGKAIADAVVNFKNGMEASSIDLTPTLEVDKKEDITLENRMPPENTPKKPVVTKTETKPIPEKKEVTTTQVQKPENKVVQDKTPIVSKPSGEITFRVQLKASAEVYPLEPKYFNGLDQISKEPYKNLYRYTYGNAATMAEAEALKATAKSKGYSDCYVVGYKNGERIPLYQAQKLAKKQ
ncbi:N-acetylmuramoyl-L-alanine amidase [Croceivirga lutea]|uniref:N-acetylmuramoyl-L-alanine amidase family protein n=1 Tax=Croceivirga lutea TaxID=1775167 RepID=UPI00163B3F0E|nr:N-acetylmuramoyl-L-alanine amidase [Croceivirga lutea]GGG42308.1 N-acetylmuramoyl-L-alanine amidase [Croceivirga lutea]